MRKIFVFIFAFMLLCACGNSSAESDLYVYRVFTKEHQVNGELLVKEDFPSNTVSEKDISSLLTLLMQKPSDVKTYNPLEGIDEVTGVVIDGTAKITLSGDFSELSGFEKTLSSAVLTLTLSSLPEVQRLDIYVGEEIFESGLVSADMQIYETTNDPARLDICLYFANEDNTSLIPEFRSLSIDESSQPERYIIEELLNPPEDSGLKSPIPLGTELLGITSEGKTCTLNFSAEFLENKPQNATEEILTVYSIVNSLTFLSDVSEVVITVEGEPVENYVNLHLVSPMTKLSLISANEGRDSLYTKLYLAHGEKLFGVPSIMNSSSDNVQTVLDQLMFSSGFGAYTSLFSSSDDLNHVETSYGTCKITISRSFFDSRTETEASLAVDALVKTLTELENVDDVKITYSNGNTPIIESLELENALNSVNADIIK